MSEQTECPIINNELVVSAIIFMIGLGVVVLLTYLNTPTEIIAIILGIGFFGLMGLVLIDPIMEVIKYLRGRKD